MTTSERPTNATPLWHAELLGGWQLYDAKGSVVERVSQYSVALLARLIVARDRAVGREKITALLWPELDSSTARKRLNDCLHVLRTQLRVSAVDTDRGNEVVHSVGDDLRLDRTAFTSDLEQFETARESGELEKAVSLYHGPLLDGFFLADVQPFDQWLETERDSIRRRYGAALMTLARGADNAGDTSAAKKWWAKLEEHDPSDTDIALGQMQMYEAARDLPGALRAFERHSKALMQALEVTPAEPVLNLAKRLRSQLAATPVTNTSLPIQTVEPDTRSIVAEEASLPSATPAHVEVQPPAIRRPKTRRNWIVAAASIVIASIATLVIVAQARSTANPTSVGPDVVTSDSADGEILTAPLLDQADALRAAGRVLVQQRKFKEAEDTLRKALTLYERTRESSVQSLGSTHYWLGRARFGQRKYLPAEQSFRLALPLLGRTEPPDSAALGSTQYWLGRALFEQQHFPQAEQSLRDAVRLLTAVPSTSPLDLGSSHFWLGRALFAQQKFASAEQSLTQALKLMERARGPADGETRLVRQWLADAHAKLPR